MERPAVFRIDRLIGPLHPLRSARLGVRQRVEVADNVRIPAPDILPAMRLRGCFPVVVIVGVRRPLMPFVSGGVEYPAAGRERQHVEEMPVLAVAVCLPAGEVYGSQELFNGVSADTLRNRALQLTYRVVVRYPEHRVIELSNGVAVEASDLEIPVDCPLEREPGSASVFPNLAAFLAEQNYLPVIHFHADKIIRRSLRSRKVQRIV